MSDEKNKIESGTLYLVATPIGNLSDLSERAKKVLAGVDFVAAEDTRVTSKLLMANGMNASMLSYHEHNKKNCGETILRRLSEGESCALVTDAGTPGISDPGEDLVKLCIEYGINVTSVPGPCAAIAALTVSGLDTRRFVFEGFLEDNKNARTEHLVLLKSEKRTMVFYVSPHDLLETLQSMYEIFGERDIALCRELTKLNEEILRLSLSEAVMYYSENNPRGEYVMVVSGLTEETVFWKNMTIPEQVDFYINEGMERMDAIKQTARDRGVGKNAIYNALLGKDS